MPALMPEKQAFFEFCLWKTLWRKWKTRLRNSIFFMDYVNGSYVWIVLIEGFFACKELYGAFDRILRFAPGKIVETVIELFAKERNIVL